MSEPWENLGAAMDATKRTSVQVDVTPSGRGTLDASDVNNYVSLNLTPERAQTLIDALQAYLLRQPPSRAEQDLDPDPDR